MAWERGYYYRVRRENGRVVREYVGRGPVAELIARLDQLEREERHIEAEALRNEQAKLDDLDAHIEALIESTELVVRAALVVAGYHQHNRGEWRKCRGHRNET